MSELQPYQLILSVSRGLWGEVSPRLRKVMVKQKGRSIFVKTIFDGEISDDDKESSSIVITSVIADFPEYDVIEQCVRLDAPQKIEASGWHLVFARKE